MVLDLSRLTGPGSEGALDPASVPREDRPSWERCTREHERGGYNLEINLGEEAAHDRSDDVDRLVRELSGEDGVHEVLREDREIILVRAPDWSKDTLQAWTARRM